MAARLSLEVDAAPGQIIPRFVGVVTQDASLLSAIADWVERGGALRSLLQVSVLDQNQTGNDLLPPMSGRHMLPGDGIRFTPHFPFQEGLHYRISFDPRPLGCPGFADVATRDFSLLASRGDMPGEVERIFPSADELPENLLRFFVWFSQPMQRGQAGLEVVLLGSDGQPVQDALYRAPVELWDKSMRCLTVLLDPGRLKRGVGPNRELGPPLSAGQTYTLAIGAGMTGSSGRRLSRAVHKRFSVTRPVREPITEKGWELVLPTAGTCTPLLVRFTRPLDRALLRQAITVSMACGQVVHGCVEIVTAEKGFDFRPTTPWMAKLYHVSIAAELEDVCGNSLVAAFDGPFRNVKEPADGTPPLTLPFFPP